MPALNAIPPFNKDILSLNSNTFILFDKVPLKVMEDVGKKINNLRDDSNKIKLNNELAGAIDDELYLLSPNSLREYINNLFLDYTNAVPEFLNSIQSLFSRNDSYPGNIKRDIEYTINLDSRDTWVNFQKKHEYNPIHSHSGILSWVIWYQIPYDIEKEKYGGPGQKEEGLPHGQFHFYCSNGGSGIGNQSNILGFPLDVDLKWNGTIALFPSNLNHQVFPFYTSNEERITIAGNIYFDNYK